MRKAAGWRGGGRGAGGKKVCHLNSKGKTIIRIWAYVLSRDFLHWDASIFERTSEVDLIVFCELTHANQTHKKQI